MNRKCTDKEKEKREYRGKRERERCGVGEKEVGKEREKREEIRKKTIQKTRLTQINTDIHSENYKKEGIK